MTNRAIYEAIASEVVANDTPLTTLAPFSNLAVRDAILVAGCEDEVFTQTLFIKVSSAVSIDDLTNSPITQAHAEALATVHHLATLWEDRAVEKNALEALNLLINRYELSLPNLTQLTLRMADSGWNMSRTRLGLFAELKTAVFAGLDKEVEA